MTDSIRSKYEQHGARAFYERHGAEYRNPHEPAIRRLLETAVRTWPLDLADVLDLACGSGEVTLALRELGAKRISGIDPFTADAYLARTSQPAELHSFEQIASGALAGRRFSLIVCSFALHLVEPSRLPALMFELSRVSDSLVVLTPHKRPVLKPAWGWTRRGELVVERVRASYYATEH